MVNDTPEQLVLDLSPEEEAEVEAVLERETADGPGFENESELDNDND